MVPDLFLEVFDPFVLVDIIGNGAICHTLVTAWCIVERGVFCDEEHTASTPYSVRPWNHACACCACSSGHVHIYNQTWLLLVPGSGLYSMRK